MERDAEPKRFSRDFGVYVAGAVVATNDPDLADILFLDKHPGWTWRDLQETPADVIALMRELDSKVK